MKSLTLEIPENKKGILDSYIKETNLIKNTAILFTGAVYIGLTMAIMKASLAIDRRHRIDGLLVKFEKKYKQNFCQKPSVVDCDEEFGVVWGKQKGSIKRMISRVW